MVEEVLLALSCPIVGPASVDPACLLTAAPAHLRLDRGTDQLVKGVQRCPLQSRVLSYASLSGWMGSLVQPRRLVCRPSGHYEGTRGGCGTWGTSIPPSMSWGCGTRWHSCQLSAASKSSCAATSAWSSVRVRPGQVVVLAGLAR